MTRQFSSRHECWPYLSGVPINSKVSMLSFSCWKNKILETVEVFFHGCLASRLTPCISMDVKQHFIALLRVGIRFSLHGSLNVFYYYRFWPPSPPPLRADSSLAYNFPATHSSRLFPVSQCESRAMCCGITNCLSSSLISINCIPGRQRPLWREFTWEGI